jgi:hypothetical protein
LTIKLAPTYKVVYVDEILLSGRDCLTSDSKGLRVEDHMSDLGTATHVDARACHQQERAGVGHVETHRKHEVAHGPPATVPVIEERPAQAWCSRAPTEGRRAVVFFAISSSYRRSPQGLALPNMSVTGRIRR